MKTKTFGPMEGSNLMNGNDAMSNGSQDISTTLQHDLGLKSSNEILNKDGRKNRNNNNDQQNVDSQNDSQGQKSNRKKKKKNKANEIKGPDQIIADKLKMTSYKIADLSEIIDQKFYLSKEYSREVKHLLSDISYDCTISFQSEMDHKVYPDGYQPDDFQPIPPYSFTQLTSIYDKPIVLRRNRRRGKPNTKKH